jgi:predicted phosphodiesterase
MKLWILSDLHTEFESFDWPAKYANVLILAGDCFTDDGVSFIRQAKEHAEHVLFVPGNHEFYGYEYHARLEYLKSLPCEVLHNRAIEINGVKFAGSTLWTDFNDDDWFAKQAARRDMNDFYTIKWHNRNLHPDDTVKLNEQARKFLYGCNADVVITHHIPDTSLIHKKWDNNPLNLAFANTRINFNKISPKLWVFGHTHDSVHTNLGDTLFICNPKGYYNEDKEFKPDYMVEI